MRKTLTALAGRRALLTLVGLVLLLSMPTHAKLSVGSSILLYNNTSSSTIWETDFAFDAETGVGLLIFRLGETLRGVYVQPNGQPAAASFAITTTAVRAARVAARSKDGLGGFLIRYYVDGTERALFVHPDSATIIGPYTIESAADLPAAFRGGGVAYAPEFDAFLVTYHKNDDTYVKWVKVSGSSLQVQSTPVQLTSGTCSFDASEIAWDAGTNRALVAGRRDVSDGCAGAVWMRRISFDGSAITALGTLGAIADNARYDDIRLAFSDLIDKWVAVFVQVGPALRPVLKRTIDPEGGLGTLRNILPANTGNSTTADDKFGRDNGLGLAYNPMTGRFLLAAKGNDSDTGLAPVFAMELDTAGDAIPRTLVEYLPFDAKIPDPRPVALPNSAGFLITTKASSDTGASMKQLRSVVIGADGTTGTGSWPLNSGTDVGSGGSGGGGAEPPPPPPPSGSVTLTITRPANGIIVGSNLYCGMTSSSGTKCQVTKTAGSTVTLAAYAASGYFLQSWGGCAASFTISANKTCAPTFAATSGGGGSPPPSGSISLRVINPSTPNGGSVFWSGVGWIHAGQSVIRTYTSPTSVTLSPFAKTGYDFVGWLGAGCANVMTVNNERVCTVDWDAEP